jgi:molecular chaperone DnaJ
MKHHPDRNPGDQVAEEHFKEAKEAYEVLELIRASEPLTTSSAMLAWITPPAAGSAAVPADLGDIFGGVFRDIFGGMRGGGGQGYRGSDLRYTLDLTWKKPSFGTTAKIRMPTLVSCASCAGSGAKPGTKPTTCPTCRGRRPGADAAGFFLNPANLSALSGAGHDHSRTVRDVPRQWAGGGAENPVGQGAGRRGQWRPYPVGRRRRGGENSGPPGDLYVQIRVKPHPIFTREDNDLYCDVPISFTTAALGGELEAPTLDGRISLKIPAETQTGKGLPDCAARVSAGARRRDR